MRTYAVSQPVECQICRSIQIIIFISALSRHSFCRPRNVIIDLKIGNFCADYKSLPLVMFLRHLVS